MKRVGCLLVIMSTAFSLSGFAVETQQKKAQDLDVVEDTDIYAIPLDKSADEDEALLAKLKTMSKKEEVKKEEAKKPEQKK